MKKGAANETSADMTRAEAAAVLGVNVRTIDRMIKDGMLHATRPPVVRGRGGIRILVRRAEVERLAAAAPTPNK